MWLAPSPRSRGNENGTKFVLHNERSGKQVTEFTFRAECGRGRLTCQLLDKFKKICANRLDYTAGKEYNFTPYVHR